MKWIMLHQTWGDMWRVNGSKVTGSVEARTYMECRIGSKALAVEGVARWKTVARLWRLPEGADDWGPRGQDGSVHKLPPATVVEDWPGTAATVLVGRAARPLSLSHILTITVTSVTVVLGYRGEALGKHEIYIQVFITYCNFQHYWEKAYQKR